MKVVVNAADLAAVTNSFPTKALRTRIAPVTFVADGDGLTITVLHEQGIYKVTIPAQVEEPGKVLPDAKSLTVLLKNCPKVPLTLATKGEDYHRRLSVTFVAENGLEARYDLPVLPDEYEAEENAVAESYGDALVQWDDATARFVWQAAQKVRPFVGEPNSGLEDIMLDADDEGQLYAYASDGVTMVLYKLPEEAKPLELPARLPKAMFSLMPPPVEEVMVFRDTDSVDNFWRYYIVSGSHQLTLTTRAKAISIPAFIKADLPSIDSFLHIRGMDRKAITKAIEIADAPRKRAWSSGVPVVRFVLKPSEAQLQLVDKVDMSLIAQVSLPTPEDLPEPIVGVFALPYFKRIVQSLPIAEFGIRLVEDSNLRVFYGRSSDKSLTIVLAGLTSTAVGELADPDFQFREVSQS